MNGDGLPDETEPPVSEDLRQRGIDYLQELLASGKWISTVSRQPSMHCSGSIPSLTSPRWFAAYRPNGLALRLEVVSLLFRGA